MTRAASRRFCAGDAKDARTRGMRFQAFLKKSLAKKLSENYIYWVVTELRGQTWGKVSLVRQ